MVRLTTVEVDPEALVEDMVNSLDYNALIRFVETLDRRLADEEFTRKLISLTNQFKAELWQ